MLRRGGYTKNFLYRFGFWPKLPPKNNSKKRIWIQAVSVGELSSIHFLLESLFKEPDVEIVLSGTTSTGQKIARQKYSEYVLSLGPFPLDWFPFSWFAWSIIKPDLAICVDSELWPEHMNQAKNRKVPFLILNGRLSDRSFKRLNSLGIFRSIIIPNHIFVIASSEKQRKRWIQIGVNTEKCLSLGNLKVDMAPYAKPAQTTKNQIKQNLGFANSSIVLAGISTWPGEEKLLLDSLSKIRKQSTDLRLLLIPRHAERGKEIMGAINSFPFNSRRRTNKNKDKNDCIVYLADTTGELNFLIKCADFAFLGKTMPPRHEGQNPIEPAAAGLPLVMGPRCTNFSEISKELIQCGAAIEAFSPIEVEQLVSKLAKEKDIRDSMSKAGLDWREKQGSPSQKTLNQIKKILSDINSD